MVKPGFVKTKMTNNMNLNKFLIITPERLAKKFINVIKKYIIYLSLLWRIILFIYKIIPEKIFIKLKNLKTENFNKNDLLHIYKI